MPYSNTTNTLRFGLVLSGFITLVACGDIEEVASPINEAPTASNVTITDDNVSNAQAGDILTGNYTYADVENDAEGASTYRWLRNGKIIGGATTLSYTLAAVDIGQSIAFEVTPVAATGTATGIAASSGAPVANAGADQTFLFGDTVILDGSASSDVDGDMLTYKWSFTSVPLGSRSTLSDTAAVNPSFDIDVSGDYVVQLIVKDGTVDSAADTVTISTSNSAPVANAGAAQTPLFGETVTLDGSASSDVDGDPLTYNWSIASVPTGSTSFLFDPTTLHPIFVFNMSGDYVVQLIVNDGMVNSAADTVTISTSNSAPVANAGVDQTPSVGDTVTLDGSASSDVDDDTLTYRWSFLLVPPGSRATLSDPASVSLTFVIDESGHYFVQLIVNDGMIDSVADTVTISAP